jgi:hypothetical protein
MGITLGEQMGRSAEAYVDDIVVHMEADPTSYEEDMKSSDSSK